MTLKQRILLNIGHFVIRFCEMCPTFAKIIFVGVVIIGACFCSPWAMKDNNI